VITKDWSFSAEKQASYYRHNLARGFCPDIADASEKVNNGRGGASCQLEKYAADPEVRRYMTWVPHDASDTVASFLESLYQRHAEGTEYSWVIANRKHDRPFAMIGARVRGHKADIGYVLAKEQRNRGYMTEAISAVSAWMLAQPGFEREGVLRRWIVHPNCPNGPRDCYIVARGDGNFFDGALRYAVAVAVGSFIFVPAGQEHRFESFSDDFAVWVFFYGPEGGESAS
jgi:ribosomal-protein-alanine N-acetyltransferase